MLGTIVNAAAIVLGSFLGKIMGAGLRENFKVITNQAIGLGVILVGLKMAFSTEHLLVVLLSLLTGAMIGETLKIEYFLGKLGATLEARFDADRQNGSFAKGFVTASLIYCVGAMAVVGSLQSGLTGNHSTLFAKSLLDGVMSVILASSMGLGVAFSALAVLVYQGAITMLSTFIAPLLTDAVVKELTSTGGLLITAIGFNILEIKQFKVGNLLPAIFAAVLIALIAERFNILQFL